MQKYQILVVADSGLEPGLRVMSPLCYQLHQTASDPEWIRTIDSLIKSEVL